MSDTNVKIKLTADAKQVRSELKLIDRDMQELGGNSNAPKKNKNNSSESPQNQQSASSTQRKDSGEIAKQESRDKVNSKLSRELTLIRKELQKINGTGGQSKTSSGTQQPTQSNGNNEENTSSPSAPSGNGNGGKNDKLGDVVGKLATAAVALKVASSAWNSLSASAKSAASGESMAYKAYGNTLVYTDYNTARKDASNMGSPYGYDYETVINAGDTNMSKAGFKDLDSYNNDLDAILAASKCWGIDASTLAGTSGYMSSIGVSEVGDQDKFIKLLSQSIVDAQMTGREDEQLQVLEQIAEGLGQVNTTVSEKSVTDQLNMYNSLVDQNENLKGSRGVSLINSMQNLATSGDTSLDILAGLNSEFTGKEGYIELRKMAEENAPEYWKRVVSGARQYGYDDKDIEFKLLKSSGLTTSQIEDLLKGIDNYENFSIDDTKEGEEEQKKRLENYSNSDVSTQEQYEVEKKEKSDDRGDVVNTAENWYKNWYNGLSDGAQHGLDGLGFIAKAAGAIGGTKLATKGLSSLKGKLFGSGSSGSSTSGVSGAADVADDVANAASNSVDEAASALADSTDDVINAAANSVDDAAATLAGTADDIAANSVDDVASSTLSSGAKGVLGKVLGPLVSLGVGAYNYSKAENDWERSEAVGQTGGNIIGSSVGSIAGPLGSIAGGWAVGELGKEIGDDVENGEKNFGSKLAGIPFIGGFWQQKGTLSQQEIKKENKEASKKGGGLPSEFGLPSTLNNYLKDNGDINWSGMESGLSSESDYYRKQMENKYGMTYDELQKWKDSDEYSEYRKKHGFTKIIDTSGYGKSKDTNGDFGIDTNGEAKMIVVNKNGGAYKDLYDASKDKLNQGYYNVWTGTKKQLEEYKANRGSMMVSSDYYNKAKTVGATEENPYMQTTDSVDDNTSAIEDNTKAIKELTKNDNATSPESSPSNSYANPKKSNSKKLGTNGSPSNDTVDPTSIIGGFWSRFKSSLGTGIGATSHATGNDYVPYDNYLASLHKGEMVLTKFEADDYRQGKTDGSGNKGLTGSFGATSHSIDININLGGSVDGLSLDNQDKLIEAVKQQLSSAEVQNLISNGFQRVQNC